MAKEVYQPNKEEILYQMIDAEYILLNLTNGNYFSLDNLGVYLWECVINRIPVEAFTEMLASLKPEPEEGVVKSAQAVFREILQEGLSIVCETPAEDYMAFVDDLMKKIIDGEIKISPVVLHSYKNIQEKYAHPCGVKEI